jgi:phosphate-selective porin OprO and OprP
MKSIKLLVMLMAMVTASNAQNIVSSKFGKGIKIKAEDESFSMKFSTRIQNRYEGAFDLGETQTDYSDKIYLRRARLKFDGYAFSPKLVYKIEFDAVNGFILDAAVKWKIAPSFELWAGQTKLPGNRERVISSQKLQFVDRSMLNSRFTLDRDKGVQLRHKMKVGKVLVRSIVALSLGEGLNYKGSSNGHSYTGRVEVLPFGKFTNKGDYFASDLSREAKPKLALAATYEYNQKAQLSRGQKGSEISLGSDLGNLQADLMFKFNGISIMGEYAYRTVVNGETVSLNLLGDVDESYFTGSAVNLSMGYLFKNNWETAIRYTVISPESITRESDITEYTFGISRYVVGHNLKVQGDITYRQMAGENDSVLPRLQFEVSF